MNYTWIYFINFFPSLFLYFALMNLSYSLFDLLPLGFFGCCYRQIPWLIRKKKVKDSKNSLLKERKKENRDLFLNNTLTNILNCKKKSTYNLVARLTEFGFPTRISKLSPVFLSRVYFYKHFCYLQAI
jgi:hypothetical protein